MTCSSKLHQSKTQCAILYNNPALQQQGLATKYGLYIHSSDVLLADDYERQKPTYASLLLEPMHDHMERDHPVVPCFQVWVCLLSAC